MHGHQYIKKIKLIIVNSPFEKNSLIISPLLVLYKEKIKKMPIKSVKIKISKNKKFHFLRVTSRVLCPNFKSLAQTV